MSRPRLAGLFPEDARDYRGPAAAWWVAVAYLAILTARSLVHMFAADGGAESIATVDTAVAGGDNVIALFGQWGAIQLLLAALLWLLLLRYRAFTPIVLLVCITEPILRALSAHLKPLETVGVAPGQALNWIAVPLLLLALVSSLRRRE